MKAIWNGHVIAEADKSELIYIERNWYFPPSGVNHDFLRKSNTPYTCPWRGVCRYFDVGLGDAWAQDAAFCYPEPDTSAIDRVKQDFSGYFVFWREVTVEE